MEISSPGQTLELVAYAQLPEPARADFDHIPNGNSDAMWRPRFFPFRDEWFDVDDFDAPCRASEPRDANPRFMPVPDDSPLLEWDAVQTQDAFSAVVIRYVGADCAAVIPGYATW